MPKPLVLVLDDSAAIRAGVVAILEGEGFPVYDSELWSDVNMKLARTKDARTILICDLNMPGIRGEDFCRIVREHYKNVKIIIYTGSGGDRVQALSRSLTVPVMIKSTGPEALLALVEKLAVEA